MEYFENVTDVREYSTPLQPTPSASAPDELRQIGILEVLANDPRPSFIIDLEEVKINGWRPTYTNSACLSALSDALVLRDDNGAGPFRSWAGDTSDDRVPQFRHNGKLWISYDLRSRWRVMSGTKLQLIVNTDNQTTRHQSISDGTESMPNSWVQLSSKEEQTAASTEDGAEEVGWIESLPNTPFVESFFKPFDWTASPLGPMAHWPYLLRRSARFVLADPAASCLFWGEEYCCVYNAGYGDIMGSQRRALLGQPASVVWPEVYDGLLPVFNEVRASRQACGWNNIQFFIERNGMLTETYWDWNLIPLMEGRKVGTGFYSSVHETTRQYLANRRSESLLQPVHARDTVTYWNQIRTNFSKNPWDAPLAAFYDVQRPRRLSQDSDGLTAPKRCTLRGSIGIPSEHSAFPTSTELSANAPGLVPYFFQAANQRESLILTTETHTEFFKMLDGVEWGGFKLPSWTIVIFCLRLGDEILGFVLLGLNPRRPYSSDEHRFIDALDTQLSASLAAAAMIERSQENEMQLKQRLAQSKELIEMTDARYRAITELNPLGIINITPEGSVLYANKTWFEITGHPPEADYSKVSFRHIIPDEDLPIIDEEFRIMVEEKKKRYYEIRLKKMRYCPELHSWQHRWILCTGGPEYDEVGNVRSVIGCITDITAQKLAEAVQSHSRKVAEEAKAAQEKFMDATSHEMRNPLSAILQSVDDISTSLQGIASNGSEHCLLSKSALDTCVDAANVITLCAQHQTRIVDDVLTMSKLDSHMLLVTPVPARPLAVIDETMQMHRSEFNSGKIDTEVIVEPAYSANNVDWVYCDPARLKQILINLINNAIKFTRQESKRKITVKVTASSSKPPEVSINKLQWFPSHAPDGSVRPDLTQDPSWGEGDVVYIGVVISDTGKGLTEYERNRLFNRFAQANTLTHIHYGGSGLGLFISRELTEMQGGEMGVASESGSGSAFAFYIKTRRTEAPSRPPMASRASSGQKVAQLAGMFQPIVVATAAAAVAPLGSEVHPLSGLLPTPPASITITEPPAFSTPSKSKNKNLCILVVEDNIVNQRVMTRQLLKAGCTVAVANHGREALDYLEKTAVWAANSGVGAAIDIALVDIEMPVMNGLVCARTIREYQRCGSITRHLPLMAVTANARKEQIAECLAAGMDDVTTKPFKVNDLLVRVERLIERRVAEDLKLAAAAAGTNDGSPAIAPAAA